MKIALLVQDADKIKGLLTDMVHEYVEYHSPAEALSKLLDLKLNNRDLPDLLIVDLVQTDGISGAELIQRLHENTVSARDLPAIIMQGTSSEDDYLAEKFLLSLPVVKSPIRKMLLLQEVQKHLPKP